MAVAALSACTGDGVPAASGPPAAPETPASSAGPASRESPGSPGGTAAPASSKPVRPSASGRDAAAPERVRIPAIGVSARIISLPIDRSGRLVAPKAFDVAGWNEAGPEPGENGTAVIAGHVDSRSGPAVFFRLRDLRRGDRVDVDRVDGSTARFSVTRIARYRKTGVPAGVYRATPGPELRLVTCGGAFDRGRGSYRDNIVVYAVER
ncbi:class F sortase [Actinomadura alba]|uniref:Class F sortase n=1 Tax=Actinomadura alba TaxID=406431 RepID=A0ABR7M088_9ACTN|nr:class F sortase [Actinomadura alba]